MSKSLHIKREFWPDVTDRPHFVVSINYEGCFLKLDDIYFDNELVLVSDLQQLEETRSGQVILDGGFRFSLLMEATPTGGLSLRVKASSDITFPGRLDLEGYFQIAGEYTAGTVNSLIGLLMNGDEFVI